MEWLALHLETMLKGDRARIEKARAMIEKSRRMLDNLRASKPATLTPLLKICLVCEAESLEMHPLAFQPAALEAFGAEYSESELREGFNRFGVCLECVKKHQGNHVQVRFDLRRLVDWLTPRRVLH